MLSGSCVISVKGNPAAILLLASSTGVFVGAASGMLSGSCVISVKGNPAAILLLASSTGVFVGATSGVTVGATAVGTAIRCSPVVTVPSG